MRRSDHKRFGYALVALVCAAWIVALVYLPQERWAATGVFALILVGIIWNLYEAHRATDRARGWQDEDGRWEDANECSDSRGVDGKPKKKS